MSLTNRQTYLALTDKVGTVYDEIATILGGASGIDTRAQELQKILIGDGSAANPGTGNDDLIKSLRAAAKSLTTAAGQEQLDVLLFSGFCDDLDAHCAKYGSTVDADIVGMNSYATYYNTSIPYDVLLCWEFAAVWYDCHKTYLGAANVFSPVTNMGRYEYGVGFTAETPIPTGSSSSQGYAEVNLQGSVIVTINGTCAVTVTGTDQTDASATWTGSASDLTAGSTFTLTPTVVGKRCRAVTNITVVGTATTGSFRVRSTIERTIANTGVPMTNQIASAYVEFVVTTQVTDHKITTGWEVAYALATPAMDSMGETDVDGNYGWASVQWSAYATNFVSDGFDIRVTVDQSILDDHGGSFTVKINYIAHSVGT